MMPAPRAFSTVLGLLMVATASGPVPFVGHRPALVAAGLAVIAVLAGLQLRAAATLAVLATVAAMALADPPPWSAALSGLCAAAYLVLRHAVGPTGRVVTATGATMVGAAGFALAGLVATVFPLKLPWLPLLAPIAVFGIYALAIRPFFADRRHAPGLSAATGKPGQSST